MKSSKSDKNRVLSDHVRTLHQRLVRALSLGIKCYDKKKKWQCTDVETQGHAARSISAFVNCISSDLLQHPLVKDSITDILVALEGILESGNLTVLSTAANATAKLIGLLSNSLLQYHVSGLVPPLAHLLSSHRYQICIPCAIALNCIISKLMPGRIDRHEGVWEAMQKENAIDSIVSAFPEYLHGTCPLDYFLEMASLLRTILWWWPSPSFRYPLACALCGIVALKFLENEDTFLAMVVHCMQRKQPRHVRIEALILAQNLMRSAGGCSKIMRLFPEAIAVAISDAMTGWRATSNGKIPSDQVSLVVEGCRLASISRWEGTHHSYFLKHGIDRVLLNLLLNNFANNFSQPLTQYPLEELITAARNGLYVDSHHILRPYIWDFLGWLSTCCGENFELNISGDRCYLSVLVACACFVAVDSIHKGHNILQRGFPDSSEQEPASRAVLLMIFSPCEDIALLARHYLSEVIMQAGNDRLTNILNYLNLIAKDEFRMSDSDSLRVVINLIGLELYLIIPRYRSSIVESDVLKSLSFILGRCLSGDTRIRRSKVSPHLHSSSSARACCWLDNDDWEGGDVILYYCIHVLSELIQHYNFTCHHKADIISSLNVVDVESENTSTFLLDRLLEICKNNVFSAGVRWLATYALSVFGFYGFPSELGGSIGKARDEQELADFLLVLPDGQPIAIHGIILKCRCPHLLPHGKSLLDKSVEIQDKEQSNRMIKQEVRLSAHVDGQALIKLLDFVYKGFMWTDNGMLRKLKKLAKGCNLQSLLLFLYRKHPKWGIAFPSYDFTPALGPDGYSFSDIILEGELTEGMRWSCSFCSLSTPHMHTHKIILSLRCDYLQALFQSGMQDSCSGRVKVPVGWKALTRLVRWMYSGELPKPSLNCLWRNMDMEEQLKMVFAYVELSWLSEFWFLEDFRDDSVSVVLSCLESNQRLCFKTIKFAADLAQREIVEAAVNYIGPLYPQMRDSGDLEALDEQLHDLIRAAYVHHSQESH